MMGGMAAMAMHIHMTEPGSLVQLMTWLSPAFPVGGFSYSSGLEYAAGDEWLPDGQALGGWLQTLLDHGSLRNDAVFVSLGWRHRHADNELRETNELALAMAGSSGRHLEVTAQGNAFLENIEFEIPALGSIDNVAYPVILGATAGVAEIDETMTIAAHLNSAISNQIQAAIRLGIIGQTVGVKLLSKLQPEILRSSRDASGSDFSDLGGCAVLSEIAGMNQEIMKTRLFRS
ncbi:MAG: urease accessory UreF family protein [Pseudomonadota bacterium]